MLYVRPWCSLYERVQEGIWHFVEVGVSRFDVVSGFGEEEWLTWPWSL